MLEMFRNDVDASPSPMNLLIPRRVGSVRRRLTEHSTRPVFLAKSVPARMAIISAGVVMNVIFAFVMAAVAFAIGVEKPPCVIGEVFPGWPAWQAGLRVGDTILEIAGKEMKQFRDLQTAIALGDIDPEKGVPFLARRPGLEELLTIIVKPDRSLGTSSSASLPLTPTGCSKLGKGGYRRSNIRCAPAQPHILRSRPSRTATKSSKSTTCRSRAMPKFASKLQKKPTRKSPLPWNTR